MEALNTQLKPRPCYIIEMCTPFTQGNNKCNVTFKLLLLIFYQACLPFQRTCNGNIYIRLLTANRHEKLTLQSAKDKFVNPYKTITVLTQVHKI